MLHILSLFNTEWDQGKARTTHPAQQEAQETGKTSTLVGDISGDLVTIWTHDCDWSRSKHYLDNVENGHSLDRVTLRLNVFP